MRLCQRFENAFHPVDFDVNESLRMEAIQVHGLSAVKLFLNIFYHSHSIKAILFKKLHGLDNPLSDWLIY